MEDFLMKKFISSVLAAATLLTAASLPSVAEEGKGTSVEIDTPYFVSAPTFDGVITAEEWGEKSFTVSGATAAVRGDTAPSADNTFAWWSDSYRASPTAEAVEDTEARDKVKSASYDIWLRWDTEFLYVGAVVNDPDDYYLARGRESIWNGDALQLRVDPMGPNSYLAYKDSSYDYKTTPFNPDKAASVGRVPWAYHTKICNIGFGNVGGELQAFDMADNGCGNLERKIKVNDEKKLGAGSSIANQYADGKTMATKFAMTSKPSGNGGTTNTYEIAMPWAYLDQWGLGQAAVDYVWGMSIVTLFANAARGSYYGYLTWGSGICGSQQDVEAERATCGGSQAVHLTDKNALTGETVADLPHATDNTLPEGEVEYRVIGGLGLVANYLSSTTEYTFSGGYSASADIAYVGNHPTDETKTLIGFKLGEGYGFTAGWDGYEKKFFIAEEIFDSGITRDTPYIKSNDTFDWKVGEWHNLGVMVNGTNVKVLCDGKVVLDDTDSRYACRSDNGGYEILLYNMGDFYLDNLLYAEAGYDLVTGADADKVRAKFTFDSNDDAYNHSDLRLLVTPWGFTTEKGECQKANEDSLYDHLFMTEVVDGKRVSICHFCGETHSLSIPGDADKDGAIGINDAIVVLKYIAQWSGVDVDLDAADVDVNNKVDINDAILILKKIAGWDVVLGQPQ